MLFIKASATPDVYVDRFARWALFERLRRHHSGRIPLPQAEVDALTGQCQEWIDPKTKLPKDPRECDWTGEKASVRKQAYSVDQGELYETLYAMGSMFTHGSAAIQTLYMTSGQLRTIADSRHVRGQSLLAASSAIRLLIAYTDFFGIQVPLPEVREINLRIQRLSGFKK